MTDVNNFTDPYSVFLTTFGGEVLAAYEKAIKVSPLITSRSITSGKAVEFPVHGKAFARHHIPGEDILGTGTDVSGYVDVSGGTGTGRPIDYAFAKYQSQGGYLSDLGVAKKTVTIDDLLIASVFIDDLDEVMAHYDLRSTFTAELGRALARRVDNMSVRALAAAAGAAADAPMRAATNITGVGSTADDLAGGLLDAIETLDKFDVPMEERFVILDPTNYYLLLHAAGGTGTNTTYTALLNKDYSMGNGDFAQGEVLRIAGVPIHVSNNAGFGVDFSSAEQGVRNTDLQVNLTDVKAIVSHKSAAAMVKLKDIQVESEYMIQNQGNLFVSKMACGIAPLRSDASVLVTA